MQYLLQDKSITSLSEVTPRLSSSLSTQGKTERFCQDKVLPLLLKDVTEKAEELESLGKEYHLQSNSATSRLRHFSNAENEDHGDILYNKGLFLDKLTDAVEDVEDSLECPKYTVHCYNQFSSLFETRCNESKQGIQQMTELLKEQKRETNQLMSQGSIFAKLVEEENEDLRKQEFRMASLQFEEAKADLEKVIKISHPNEEEKRQFLLVMAELVEAHINNLESIEDQYVEVLPLSFKNPGLVCLMNGFVVVQHPHNPKKLRLSVDD